MRPLAQSPYRIQGFLEFCSAKNACSLPFTAGGWSVPRNSRTVIRLIETSIGLAGQHRGELNAFLNDKVLVVVAVADYRPLVAFIAASWGNS